MKLYITRIPFGVFAIDENENIVDRILFPKEIDKIAERLLCETIIPEEKELIEKLRKKGYSTFISSVHDDIFQFKAENLGDRVMRKNFREEIKKLLNVNDVQLNNLLMQIGVEITRVKIKKGVKKDKIVMEVIDAIDELDKSLNIFSARLREWYGLHFPEMNRIIEKHEKYAKIVSEFGLKENIDDNKLSRLIKESVGIELDEKDEEMLKEYARNISNLFKLREKMEKYLEKILKEIAPNFSSIAGTLLAARLISLAGGLDKLAKKPSSTIQLLGAEKALFRYLSGKGKSPRHGILFIHPMIQGAPDKLRGKIARILASKLSIAVKMDYYGHGDKSEELKKDLEERIKKIMSEGVKNG